MLLGGQKTCEVYDGGGGDRVDNRDDSLKGEPQFKTTQKGVKEGPKRRVSSVLVFWNDPPLKEKKSFS